MHWDYKSGEMYAKIPYSTLDDLAGRVNSIQVEGNGGYDSKRTTQARKEFAARTCSALVKEFDVLYRMHFNRAKNGSPQDLEFRVWNGSTIKPIGKEDYIQGISPALKYLGVDDKEIEKILSPKTLEGVSKNLRPYVKKFSLMYEVRLGVFYFDLRNLNKSRLNESRSRIRKKRCR